MTLALVECHWSAVWASEPLVAVASALPVARLFTGSVRFDSDEPADEPAVSVRCVPALLPIQQLGDFSSISAAVAAALSPLAAPLLHHHLTRLGTYTL